MKIAILSALCVALLLQGCISTIFLGGAAAVATKSSKDPRTIGAQIDDRKLEMCITKALNKDPFLKKKARMIVNVYQKKVLLTGQVTDLESSKRVKAIIMNIKGASEIYNEIRQGHIIDIATIAIDTWITAQVRYFILISSKAKLSNIKIFTENNEVFLLGLVTKEEEQALVDITRRVTGVKRVITVFTHIK